MLAGGFFTAVLPTRSSPPPSESSSPNERNNVRAVPTSALQTTTSRQRTRTTPAFTVYAVRPTTPMGDLLTTTMKSPSGTTDFPRTALISVASVSVILVIAIVVFCVFRCRQTPPPGDQYPMVVNGKQSSGYAPISSDVSPPMVHESASQPLLGATRLPQVNGYQPINGAVIPNGNGNGLKNGGGSGRKKDFKEWYV